MVNSGSLSALLAVVLLAVVECGPSGQKLATCCTKVSNKEIQEPVLGFLVQRASPPCVQAVIFQTQSGLFCSYVRAPWVLRKINEFRKTKVRSTIPPVVSTSPVSLLSIITSTASPPSSSTALPSSSSTSQIPPSSSTALPSSSSTSQIPPSSSTALPSSSSTSQIPPSSSTALPSSSSTSQMSPGETFSESRNEQAEV